MAKVDPYFIEFRRFPGTFIMLGILFTGFEVFFDRFRYPGIFLVVLPFIVIGVLLIPYLSRWKQIEQRRWLAVDKEQHSLIPLAIEQPKPDESALPVPATIKLWSTWKAPLICFLLLVLLTNGLVALLFYEIPRHVHQSGSYLPAMIILFVCAVLLPASIAALFLCMGYQRIEVREEGLLVRTGVTKILVKWDEAALFAIYPANRISQREYPPVIYELSSPKAIVRWIRMRPDMPWFRKNHKPTIPFDEYNRQVDALLSVIAAKTHLPLYDLR